MTAAASHRFYFNTDALPERDRFPVYREQIHGRCTGLEMRTQEPLRFTASHEVLRVGTINIALGTTTLLDCVRTPRFVRDGDDALCVLLQERGVAYQIQGDNEQQIAPGGAAVCDSSIVGAYNFITAGQAWYIKIPRQKLTKLLPGDVRFAGARLERDDARRLLFGYLRGTFQLDLQGPGQGQLYEDHIVDLVALALGAAGDARRLTEQRGARTARRFAILNLIERQRADPRLSVASIATALGITPRYVHMLLEETGLSFTHHVLGQRLERAAQLLREPEWHRRKISDIALTAGFTDLSYFNRAFRRRYGLTPSDVRGAARDA